MLLILPKCFGFMYALMNAFLNDSAALGELKICAQQVTSAVGQLLDSVRGGCENEQDLQVAPRDKQQEDKQSIQRIFHATDSLFSGMGNASEMIHQAKVKPFRFPRNKLI